MSIGNSLLNGIKIKNTGLNNRIIIGQFGRIKNCNITIKGNNNRIVIGDRSFLSDVELCMEDDYNTIAIGDNTNLYGKSHFAAIEGTKIIIGDRCLFSGDVHFRTGDSHSILDSNGVRINESKDILIGNHVWIGTKVTCLKGVKVSDNCIVAATSTLLKEYNESNCIIGGIPAKVIKHAVNWDNERIKTT